jgi:tetratricopeptide (TPR) repeat protein
VLVVESEPSPNTCPVFVGRAAERAALRDLLDRVREGSGQTAIVSGEAGIGKSRLVAEISSDAAGLGFLYLEGRCYESESALPYAPLLELVREHLARPPADDGAGALPLASPLARLLPEWALALPAADNTPIDKWHVFVAITRWITELAAHRPVLLVIEDIHWGDDLSLEYLLHLARRCRHTPMLLLMTARADEAAPAARRWLVHLHRERMARELVLAPLTPAEVRQMAAALLPTGGIVGTALLETLYAYSEGNPFFIEEVLGALVTTGALARVQDVWQRTSARSPVPRSVRDIVRQRTERLSVDARRALEVAAVAGREVEYRLLRAVVGQDDESLVALVKELIAARLLIEEHADQYAFRHALIREAVYGELLGRERVAMHRTIGDAMEALWPEGPQRETHLPTLAAHFSAGGAWVKALAYGERAAEQALALHAPRAAIEHVARAEEAADQLGLPPRAAVAYLRGQAHEVLGEFDPARESYERALALARAADAPALESQCLLALGFLWAGRDYGRAGEWFNQALRLAERIGDDVLLARSLNRYGNWLANTGRISEGLEAHQRALQLFATLQDSPGRAASLDLLGIACGMAGDRVAATEHLSQAIDLFEAHGEQRSLCTSLAMRAIQSAPGSSERPAAHCARRTRASRMRRRPCGWHGRSGRRLWKPSPRMRWPIPCLPSASTAPHWPTCAQANRSPVRSSISSGYSPPATVWD